MLSIQIMGLTRQFFLAFSLCGVAATLPAQTLISSASDPKLAGSTLIDFESVTINSYSPLTVSGVTFGPSVTVDASYSNSYNNPGRSINNNAGAVSNLTIDFAAPVSAFGFNFGASDYTWTLNAYNSSNSLLASRTLPAIGASNNTALYFYGLGIGSATITKVTLTTGSSDFIFIDNFRFLAVPEPSIFALVATGVLGLGLCRRFRRIGS